MKQFAFNRRWGTLLALSALILIVAQGVTLATPPNAPMIRLQYAQFDPLQGEPVVPDQQRAQTESGALGTYLVQFSGPVQEEWKVAAESAGARLYSYVPDYAFIARVDGSALEAVKALPFVRWAGPFYPAYRLAAGLQPQALAASANPEQLIQVQVQTLPDADLDSLIDQVRAWSGSVAARSQSEIAGYLRAALPAGRVGDLAALDGVLWVEPYLERQLFNDVAGGTIMHASYIHSDLGLYGKGQIVGLADSGLDTGVTTTLSPDFSGRVLRTYCLARKDPCDWSDPIAHGTHVAGSILGSGMASGSNPGLHQYGGSFAGVAPEAQLVLQSIADGNGSLTGIPLNPGDLMRAAFTDGARIHNDSWGGRTGGTDTNPEYGGYDLDASQVDKAAWDHKDMLILFSAGNYGVDSNGDGRVDPDSLASPGTAKNVLTVGASESYRPEKSATWGQFDFLVPPISNDTLADNINGMAAFSSRGPTDDGRIKPDLVAPGTWIVSDRTHATEEATGWGVYDEDYIYFGGTSMSTPLTSGSAALVREWLTKLRGFTSPSAALMKAVLINGADDMSPGQYTTPQEIPYHRPNNVSGWGRVDLTNSLAPLSPRRIWLKDETAGLGTGASVTYTLSVGTTGMQVLSEDGGSLPETAPPVAVTPAPPQESVTQLIPVQPQSEDAVQGVSGVSQLIQNGGFELAGGWTTVDTARTTDQAYAGNWSMGSIAKKDGYFYQSVEMPADVLTATLDLYLKNLTPDLNNDLLKVRIYDQAHSTLLGVGPEWSFSDSNWHHLALDFSQIIANVRGKTIIVDFYINQNDTIPDAVFYVDNVTLTAGVPDAVPTPTSTPPPSVDTGGPFRITLAWTDYPGAAFASPALVNDLDLEVIAPDGTHYAGNTGTYTTGQCLRAEKWDACNNVEAVLLPKALYGVYKVVVHGVNVPQGPQPFALAASGDFLRQGTSPLKLTFIPLIKR